MAANAMPPMTAEGGFPAIFVISLSTSRERREHIARQLTTLGLPWEFIDAVDGLALPPDDVQRVGDSTVIEVSPGLRRRLTPGEIGCALSHQHCYRLIRERGLPMAIILEDDVDVSVELLAVMRALPRFPRNWELVLFAHHSARHGPNEGAATAWRGVAVHRRHRVARVVEFAMGAMAYLISHEGARKLLDHGTPVRMPADWLTGYAPSAGVRLFAVTPPVITPHAATPHATTLPDREASFSWTQQTPRRGPVFVRLRMWVGTVLLWMRKAGVYPDAYSRRLQALTNGNRAR